MDFRPDLPLPLPEPAKNNREVFLGDPVLLELANEAQIGPVTLGNHHRAGSIPIQSVNDAGAKRGPLGGQSIGMGEKSVDEGSVPMTGAGMDDNPASFVDDKEMFVFKKDIERHGARIESLSPGFLWQPDGHHFSRAQLVAGLEYLSVDPNPAFKDPFFDLASGSFRESTAHENIEPAARIRRINAQDKIWLRILNTVQGVAIQCCCLWWSVSRMMVKINRPAVV